MLRVGETGKTSHFNDMVESLNAYSLKFTGPVETKNVFTELLAARLFCCKYVKVNVKQTGTLLTALVKYAIITN